MVGKQVTIVAVDNSEHSAYVLEWTLEHFFIPLGDRALFKFVAGSSTDLDAVVPSSPGRNRCFSCQTCCYYCRRPSSSSSLKPRSRFLSNPNWPEKMIGLNKQIDLHLKGQ
ncbi:hypothetical protein SLEP1_g40974 [Rubroshorea leprosula]|uniref:Uncharacterized protein n=1 Tax=Rubroshorea leprosula TaxID=152421 RepID=A0AAV5L588_9ROSI|nr:hypothetical protein SLEP1_g40974 [Rubroshorea leprosula]